MATTITTTTSSYGTKGGRHTGVTSAGVDWVMHYDLFNTRMEFWYSTNDGTSWTEATSLRVTLAANRAEEGEFFIGEHDRACFAACGAGGYTIQYVPELTSTATWTVLTSNTSQDTDHIRCRVFDYGTLSGTPTYVILGFEANLGGELDWWSFQRKVSDDTAYSEQRVVFHAGNGDVVDFDFGHNGDGITAVNNPDIYVIRRDLDNDRTIFERRQWNATQRGWSTVSSPRTLSNTGAVDSDPVAAVFDGTRFVMVWIDDGSDTTVTWKERDAADTSTTTRTVPALSDGPITSLALTFDSDGDTRLYAVGGTSDDVKRIIFDRSAGTFGSWETVETATATAQSMSVQSGFQGDGINVTYTDGASSPYDIRFARDPVNTPPLAPTWVSPEDGPTDLTASTVLDWVFSDPDDGDTQSAFGLQRTVNGGSVEHFNNGSRAWGGTEVKNVTSTSTETLATGEDGFTTDGDVVVFKVRTWDASDEVGPWSAPLTLTGSTPVTPTITSPADAATITENTIGEVTWTASSQSAFRGRLLTSDGAVLVDTGKVTTGDKSWSPTYLLETGLVDAEVEIKVWNSEGLEGPADNHTFDVTFVAPATPTLTAVANPTERQVDVTVTHPTPTGSQPAVVTIDLEVRVAPGGRTVGERSPGTGIRIIAASPDSVVYDRAAAGDTPFEYRVRANAANGTSSLSAWTAIS